jgi:hypothetical protein
MRLFRFTDCRNQGLGIANSGCSGGIESDGKVINRPEEYANGTLLGDRNM